MNLIEAISEANSLAFHQRSELRIHFLDRRPLELQLNFLRIGCIALESILEALYRFFYRCRFRYCHYMIFLGILFKQLLSTKHQQRNPHDNQHGWLDILLFILSLFAHTNRSMGKLVNGVFWPETLKTCEVRFIIKLKSFLRKFLEGKAC